MSAAKLQRKYSNFLARVLEKSLYDHGMRQIQIAARVEKRDRTLFRVVLCINRERKLR